MKKLITLILVIVFIIGCSSTNNSDVETSTYNYTQGANITDIDGNSYPTIVTNCNNQTWMQKNLNVSHFRNGDVIPQVTNTNTWTNLTTPAWCYYNNDPANGPLFGKIYNSYAVNDPRGLAPVGYHIPTDAEWTTFTNCIGGQSSAGGAMKETGYIHWLAPNTEATNISGFTGLAGGFRNTGNSFQEFGYYGNWWSSLVTSTYAIPRRLNYNNGSISIIDAYDFSDGFSVRCIKD
jgi:uncharacterized protein (TIGR02145 family)